jgi:hypothetical protein
MEEEMASRRSRPTAPASDEARGFAVVVEKMYGEFRVFGEALAALTARVNAGFEDVGRRFTEVDHRFEQMDQRFEHVEQELAVVKHEVGLVKAVVLEHGRALKEIRAVVTTG